MQWLIDPGLWVETRHPIAPAGLPALFLDRDGVVNVDSGYVGDVADVTMLAWIGPIIAAANAAGVPVIVVTNQSGIARGYFEWPAFEAVQERIHARLGEVGAVIDAVLACGYHGEGVGALAVDNHPMRKPNPGMILHAGQAYGIDLARSSLIGDSGRDVVAAARAGLGRGWLVEPAVVPHEARAIARSFDPVADGAALAARLRAGRPPF